MHFSRAITPLTDKVTDNLKFKFQNCKITNYPLFIVPRYGFIYGYWSSKGIPSPSLWLIKRLFLPQHLHDQLLYQNYGEIVGFFEGIRPTVLISHLDSVEKILMKDINNFPARKSFNFGHMSDRIGLLFVPTTDTKWIRMRQLIEPTFCKSKLRKLTPKMNDCAFRLLCNLESLCSTEGSTVNMVKLFEAFALDVVAATAFGINLDSYNDPSSPLVKNARYFYSGSTPYKRLLFELYVSLRLLNHKMNPLESEQMSYFTRLAERIFREKQIMSNKKRKYSNSLSMRKGDFIDFFIDMMDKNHEEMPESIEEEMTQGDDELIEPIDCIDIYGHQAINGDSFSGKGSSVPSSSKAPSPCPMRSKHKILSMDQVKAHGILFFIAGYGSTSSLLSNLSYLLAYNLRVQKLVMEEIDSISTSNNGTLAHGLNADLIENLTYLSAVVWETLRLYPPISRIERLCVSDYKLSDKLTIPAGMSICVPTYAIHRSAKYFSSPNEFRPERFLSDQPLKHPWSFLPFGGGPRNCLGIRLAILQVKVAIVRVLENYELSLAPGHEDIKHTSDQVLIAPESVVLKLKPRANRPKFIPPLKRGSSIQEMSALKSRFKRQFTF